MKKVKVKINLEQYKWTVEDSPIHLLIVMLIFFDYSKSR